MADHDRFVFRHLETRTIDSGGHLVLVIAALVDSARGVRVMTLAWVAFWGMVVG